MSGKSAREERREERLQAESQGDQQERRKRLLQIGSAAIFVAVVVVAVLIVVSASNSGSGGDTNLEDVGLVKEKLKGIPQSGMLLGDPRATVTLYEFGDLQCPVCKAYSEQIVPEVIESQVKTGEANLEFRNFTIISQESIPAGAAAVAAGKQGKGWNYLELFYRNQGKEASGYVTDEFLKEIAKGAGVPNLEKWEKDRESKQVVKEVEDTTTEAQELGFTGTPSFAVEGPGTKGKETLGTPGEAALIEEAIEEAS
jgi:protein-disulfide isomerase